MRKSLRNCLLLVGMIDSPHFRTWTKAASELNVFDRIIVFPSDFPRNTLSFTEETFQEFGTKVSVFMFIRNRYLNFGFMHFLQIVSRSKWRKICLVLLIRVIQPRVIHYHEFQKAGYLVASIRRTIESIRERNCRVIGSTWGSDLRFYRFTDSHPASIQEVLKVTDIVTMERPGEIDDLNTFSFKGQVVSPIYISVGMRLKSDMGFQKPSKRNLILIKGYQNNQGRGLNALKAVEMLASELREYEIRVFATEKSPAVRYQIEILRNRYNLNIFALPKLEHSRFLEMFGRARIYMGLSEVDGLSTSMAEAMAFGAFPIQSSNSAAENFIQSSLNGFSVDTWDLPGIVFALRRAISDNKLVDRASQLNYQIIMSNYNWDIGLINMKKLYLE